MAQVDLEFYQVGTLSYNISLVSVAYSNAWKVSVVRLKHRRGSVSDQGLCSSFRPSTTFLMPDNRHIPQISPIAILTSSEFKSHVKGK